jgi:uncharacterized protein YidB (DUF937 family)
MSKGMPSLMALLGLVAVAGYQNRDKLRDMIGDARGSATDPQATPQIGSDAQPRSGGGLLDEIGQMFGGSDGSGKNLSEGLGELVTRFRTNGLGASADSWVSKDANAEVQPADIETAIGRDTIEELAQKTGLSSAEIVKRLSAAIPAAVDRFTPDGRLPSDDEAQRLI